MSETRANIKQWFAAEIFQEGRRVVWTHYCPQLNALTSLSIVRVGVVIEAPDPEDHNGKRECGGLMCHVDFGGVDTAKFSKSDLTFTHTCTCELELFDPST